jgi:transcriptional regulator with XRE-family HTH domain
VATAIRELYGVEFNASTLTQYEHGTVERPDPVILAGLARLYGTSLDSLVALLTVNRQTPGAEDVSVGAEEVVVAAAGSETDLLRCFRALPANAQTELLEFCRFKEGRPQDVDTKRRNPRLPFQGVERRSGNDRRAG